jgi:transposase-like protein
MWYNFHKRNEVVEMTQKGCFERPERAKGKKPAELTPEVQAQIIKNLLHGAYVETAVIAAGVPKVTFYEWLKRAHRGGESDPDGKYMALLNAVEKAQEEAELRDLAMISKAAMNGAWQANAWRLERKNYKRWGKRTIVEGGNTPIGVEHSGSVNVDFSNLSTEELRRLAYGDDSNSDPGAEGTC